jgi:capsular polysaccharide biosynthesis protein
MAVDLEKRQQGEQFRVMDEPNLPESPAFPKRPVFIGGGLGAGLGLGLLIIALLEYLDTALRSERDIWAFTKLPTLGVIAFNGDPDLANPKRKWFRRENPDLTAGTKPLMNAGG